MISGPAQKKVAVSKEFVGEIGNAVTIRRRFKNPGKAGTIGQKPKARSLSRMPIQMFMEMFPKFVRDTCTDLLLRSCIYKCLILL
jgi:hypothetical protein